MTDALQIFLKWLNAPLLQIGSSVLTLGGLGVAVATIGGSFLVSAIVRKIILPRFIRADGSPEQKGFAYSVGQIIHYTILILGAVLALQIIGVSLTSLAVVMGFLSVGIGFGRLRCDRSIYLCARAFQFVSRLLVPVIPVFLIPCQLGICDKAPV